MPKPRETQRSYTLKPSTDAELDAAAVITEEDRKRIAARFRDTTVPQMRKLLDAPPLKPPVEE